MIAHPLVALADISARIDYGLTTSADPAADGPKFLRITDIEDSQIDWKAVPRCNATSTEREKYRLSDGDIVVARTGASTGRSAWVQLEEDAVFASYLVRFRIRDELDSRYVSYVLRSDLWHAYVNGAAHGKSAQPNMSASSMAEFTFPCPPLQEQHAIAEVLGALDDKIALNTSVEQTSHDLAQAHFTRTMVKASQDGTVGALMSLKYGKSLPKTRRIEGNVDVYGSGGVVGTHNEAMVDGPGVVVGRKGTAGAVHWVPRDFFPIDTTFYVAPLESDVSLQFCYFLLRSLPLGDNNVDSAVPGLNRNTAESTKVRIPDPTSIRAFTDIASPLLQTAATRATESRALAATRDALLPALMSGKLRVKDAGRQVEAVV